MLVEQRLQQMGISLPDYASTPYPGSRDGSMKAHHIVGNLLFLGGHVPNRPDGTLVYTGRVGETLSVEDGYAAAHLTAINCLGGIKHALGELDRVVAIVRSLNFVVCTPDFDAVHKVANGATDLFAAVFGEECGIGGRATIGVVSLAHHACFENWLTIEFA